MKKLILLSFLTFTSMYGFSQSWDQVIKAVASDRGANDYFGESVSINGNIAIVGAILDDENASGSVPLSQSGSAYIFELNAGTWVQTAKLVASDRRANDYFGCSVSISGNKVIIGARNQSYDALNNNYVGNAGSAYIFELVSGTWTQTAKLVASVRGLNDNFGYSVSIDGDKVVIGAYQEDEDSLNSNTLTNSGSAYIFELIGGTWVQTSKLVASDRGANDNFGHSVSVNGNNVIIGAFNEAEDSLGLNTLSASGSAYIFELIGGAWLQTAKLVASDRGANDNFGHSVSISGDKVIIGAKSEDEDSLNSNTLSNSGSAYIFELIGGTWLQTAKLVASDRGANDNFGHSVSIDGDKAIIGAHFEDDDVFGLNTLSASGSAYIFELIGGAWLQTVKLVASDRGAGDKFGYSVSISEDNVIIGANTDAENAVGLDTLSTSGSAYIFNFCPTTKPTGSSAQTFCEGSNVSDLTATGISISWYADSTTTTALSSTTALVNGTKYYATATDNGCESKKRFEVTVTINEIPDANVTISENVLSANNTGTTYKWLNCDDGNSVIIGETGQSFTATTSGSYAVELTANGCSDTSACTEINLIGLTENELSNVSIYPNPSNGIVNINLAKNGLNIEIINEIGVIVQSLSNTNKNVQFNLQSGIYFVKIYSQQSVIYKKLIIN